MNKFTIVHKLSGLTFIKNAIDIPVQMQLAYLSSRLQDNSRYGHVNRSILYDNILNSAFRSDIFYEYQWHSTSDIYQKIKTFLKVLIIS